MFTRIWTLSAAAVILLFSGCGLFPTSHQNERTRFSVDIQYSGKADQQGVQPFLMSGRNTGMKNLQKTGYSETVDVVRIMVLDFSKYNDLDEFYASDEYHEYNHLIEHWSGDLSYWSEWEKLFSQSFSIAANQTAVIEADTARATVPGANGLNYFIVAMLENGKIRYAGENMALGEEGKTERIHIEVYEWWFSDYYPASVPDQTVTSGTRD